MKDFPSCFGENGVQIADSSSSSSSSSTSSTKSAQNLVTCIYQCKLHGRLTFIVLTWTKQLIGHSLTLHIQTSTNQSLAKFEIKPWIFSKKKGSKLLDLESGKIQIHWDLTNAKFNSASPEPEEGFFVAAVLDRELLFLLGDSGKIHGTAAAATAAFVARREHVFGKKSYHAKARFSERGETHNLWIECDTIGMKEPSLVIRIDSETAMRIKRLKWKFRGNGTIVVDGIPVQVMWDVHNWLFGNNSGISSSSSSSSNSAAVFMFQTYSCGSGSHYCQSSFDSSSSSSSTSNCCQQIRDCSSKLQSLDFSLILYAWRNE